MTPHHQQLKSQLDSIKSRIRISHDTMNRMRWEIEELEKDKTQLLMDIEQEKMNRTNVCTERVI